MNRYINSADALHTLKHLAYETALNQNDTYVADVFEDIAKNRLETWVDLVPTADVQEVKHGKWIDKYNDGDWHCSQCGAIVEKDEQTYRNWYWCYHCGAKMDGKETEDE